MEIKAIVISILIIHFFLWIAVTVKVYDCPIRRPLQKLLLVLLAVLIPILGPIYVNYRLGFILSSKGRSIDAEIPPENTNEGSGSWSQDSFSGDSSGSSDSGGGGGD